jgi:predicted RNase H-like HicB family nuclease
MPFTFERGTGSLRAPFTVLREHVARHPADNYSVARSGIGTALQGGHMSRVFNVVIERDEDGCFVASAPSLPGCHTQARSLDELMDRIREAIALCLEDQAQATTSLEFVGVQRVRVPA